MKCMQPTRGLHGVLQPRMCARTIQSACHQLFRLLQVLGTFITEWDDGALRCMQMFISPESAEEVAHQLASIAQHYRFEGWLLNIENMIQQHAMPNLLHFIRQAGIALPFVAACGVSANPSGR